MADLIFTGGHIWTGDFESEPITAVAVTGGLITALGKAALAQITARTTIVDLAGGMLLPGFGDGHAHPLFGGEELAGVPATGSTTLDDLLLRVKSFAEANPQREWVTGGAYVPALAPDGNFDARWLDEIVPDRPVVLASADHHTIWVNTEALRRAGITSDTRDPLGGVIVRRPDGSPLGMLQETAQELVFSVMPPKTLETQVDELAAATRVMADAGITWVQCAGATPDEVAAYRACSDAGRMPVRMAVALWASPTEWRDEVDVFTSVRAGLPRSDRLTVNSIKFLGDGALASADNPTASMIDAYESDHSWHGVSIWNSEELKLAAAAFDAAGFQLHIHGVGDAAVRHALDAIEYTEAQNGVKDRRPVVAHVIVAQEIDLARFEDLGAIPCMTPVWAQANEWTMKIVIPAIGEKREHLLYPIGALEDSTVPLSFGSDWPVTTHRPLEGIATAVSRQTADGHPAGGWLPEQRISLDAALAAYTSGPAFQGHRENEAGRIRVGMVADLVQLDRDLYEVAVLEIPDVRVVGTWISGVRQ